MIDFEFWYNGDSDGMFLFAVMADLPDYAWHFFSPGVELNHVDRSEIYVLPYYKILSKSKAWLHGKIQPRGCVQHRGWNISPA